MTIAAKINDKLHLKAISRVSSDGKKRYKITSCCLFLKLFELCNRLVIKKRWRVDPSCWAASARKLLEGKKVGKKTAQRRSTSDETVSHTGLINKCKKA
jgi:hypothetical protein